MIVKNVWPLIFKRNVQHDWNQNENLRESDAKISFTKQNLGWLDASAIATHMGQTHSYDLHTLGLVQPPPTGRSTAVQVGTGGNFLMVEARQKVDNFSFSTHVLKYSLFLYNSG
jgi:hypothetical protein